MRQGNQAGGGLSISQEPMPVSRLKTERAATTVTASPCMSRARLSPLASPMRLATGPQKPGGRTLR